MITDRRPTEDRLIPIVSCTHGYTNGPSLDSYLTTCHGQTSRVLHELFLDWAGLDDYPHFISLEYLMTLNLMNTVIVAFL